VSRADRFLNACRRQPVDATPIWLMRQAGRYMAEYRALRQQHSLLEMIKSPDLATEVTLQPIHAFDVDAAIIFADILTLPEAMGLDLEFVAGEGPVFHQPIRHADDLKRLKPIDPTTSLDFTLKAISQVTATLQGTLPLIGFGGAPFTLACYIIEGQSSRHFLHAKQMMYNAPDLWHALMQRLAHATADYLIAQTQAGAAALQLFDSWVGALSVPDYQRYVLPHMQDTLQRIRAHTDVPLIYFGTDTAALLPTLKQLDTDVIGIDWRIELGTAWQILGPERAIQGNLDPTLLYAQPETCCAAADHILDQAAGRPGHIFNLGHGILPTTPPDHVAALIDHVHQRTQQDATS
jgi:uroporphyrinogen decarboxylase